MRFFIDMDGTLAKWNNVEFEQLFEQGYYRNLEPNNDILNDVNRLIEQGEDIYILSCVLPESQYALEEKKAWLKEYVPNLSEDKYIFVPYGKNKADYLKEHYSPITNKDYLIDDYTKNLIDWKEYGGIGVKYLNGINHTKGTWHGLMVYDDKMYDYKNLSDEYTDRDNLSTGLTDLVIGEKLKDYGIDMIASYSGYGKGDQRFSCIYNSEFYYINPSQYLHNGEYVSPIDTVFSIRNALHNMQSININAFDNEMKQQYYNRHYPTLSELSKCEDFDKLVSQLDSNTLDDLEYSVYICDNDGVRVDDHSLLFKADTLRLNKDYIRWYEVEITTDELIAKIKGEKTVQKRLPMKEQIKSAQIKAQELNNQKVQQHISKKRIQQISK